MKFRSMFSLLFLSGAVVMTSGCGVLYSQQNYGSPATNTVTQGATKADVFANLGQPNAIYRSESGEVFIYKNSTGRNYLGLYSTVKREDTVVILDANGGVAWVSNVPVGSGMTIISPPMLDATHPVHTDTLLFEPENYEYKAELTQELQ